MPMLDAFMVSKMLPIKHSSTTVDGDSRSRCVAVLSSLNCFGNDLICWQLIRAVVLNRGEYPQGASRNFQGGPYAPYNTKSLII